VTSWYRPRPVNEEVGGVSDSQHIPGLAADIYTMDATDQSHPRNREFEKWLDTSAWADRALGYGCAANRGFTHVDLRPGRIRWNY
jgi:putative chitinase